MCEDLDEAASQGKRLLVIWEQRGCIYCTKMHEEIFPDPEIGALLKDRYFVVQMNLLGDEEVTDFDGTIQSERQMAARWGVVFAPTMMFMPEEVPEGAKASEAAVATMPGAFGRLTTKALLTRVLEKGYEGRAFPEISGSKGRRGKGLSRHFRAVGRITRCYIHKIKFIVAMVLGARLCSTP